MYKVWIRFTKIGRMKYIGHLDLIKVMQMALRRAAWPVAYSQGFNPHILLSVALPLPLGMESEREYAEITVTENISPEASMDRLNRCMPEGLCITGLQLCPPETPGLAAKVAAADYALTLPKMPSPEILQHILAEREIVVPKKTKSGIRHTDIRPDIWDLRYSAPMLPDCVYMRLSAGSARNVKPGTVADLIVRYEAGFRSGSAAAENEASGEIIGTALIRRLDLLSEQGDSLWQLNKKKAAGYETPAD